MNNPPDWWDWELEISSHCLKRMSDRGFNEADLRTMMDDAESVVLQSHGTFLVTTVHNSSRWEVIVCPDEKNQVVIAVTAYANP